VHRKYIYAFGFLVTLVLLGGIGYWFFRPQILDYRKYRYIARLANEGDSAYQRLLGEYFYEKGDFESAFKWEIEAADAGDAGAQHFMGLYFRYGINDQLKPSIPDYVQAREWFEKAAAQDFPTSQVELCEMHFGGIGIAPDNKEAYFWCSLSAEFHGKAEKFKQLARDGLDQEQQRSVESRVATWLDSNRKRP